MEPDDGARRLAERQHAVLARNQLRHLGMTRAGVDRRLDSGSLVIVTPRVLRVAGAPRTAAQLLMAAVLDAGAAVASHRAAAALWRLPGFRFGQPEVTRLRSTNPRSPSLGLVHRPRLLLPHHMTDVRGIPCTTLPRTIFDLAGLGIPDGRIEALVNVVVKQSPAMLPALHAMLDELARRGRAGITTMRLLLADHPVGTRLPESQLERRFEEILRRAQVDPFERQVDVGGHEWLGRVDFADRALKLLVEVDSERHHTAPWDKARDEARDEAMLAAGWRMVLRVPEEHIWHQPWLAVKAVRDARLKLRAESPHDPAV